MPQETSFANDKITPQLHALFIRNVDQGLGPKVPQLWTSNDQTVVLKVP